MGIEMKSNLPYISLFVICVFTVVLIVVPSCSSMGTKPSESDFLRFSHSKHYDQQEREFFNRDREAMKRLDKI